MYSFRPAGATIPLDQLVKLLLGQLIELVDTTYSFQSAGEKIP
jgi:hypothetical protein